MELEYRDCPICGQKENELVKVVMDHMITKELFNIVKCVSCGFLYTNPIPAENEIGNYYKSENYISHSSSKKGIINFLYNQVRKKTTKNKYRLINKYTNNKRVLEVGSGTGHFLSFIKSKGYDVTGLEPDEDARFFAKSQNNVNLNPLSDLNQLSSSSFGVLVMWHVLEHVYHLKRDVEQIISKLDKQAYLFIAVPNHESYDAQYYDKFWAAYDVPRHLYHFRKKDIETLFKPYHVDLVDVIPMKYDSYYVSMLSEKYKSGSIFNAIIQGFKSNLKAKNLGYSSQIYVLKLNK